MARPPQTLRIWPVTKLARSLAKKSTASATSDGLPKRRMGVARTNASRCFSGTAAISGVTAAQQFNGTATNYVFTVPGAAGLAPGSHIVVEVVMLVTTSAGGLTGQINAISLTM